MRCTTVFVLLLCLTSSLRAAESSQDAAERDTGNIKRNAESVLHEVEKALRSALPGLGKEVTFEYEGKEATPWTGTLELPPVEVEILPDVSVDLDARNPSQRTVDEGQALGVLETFLGALASKDFKAAHELVAPSSKKRGDPVAYRAPLYYRAFLRELKSYVDDDIAPSGGLRKFMGYELGDRRWESADRFRVLVTFQGWDRDEVIIVREDGKWYVADPIHIIR